MLDVQGLDDFIDAHYSRPGDRLFRMEMLPLYSVESDGTDWERWRAGATEPSWDRKQPWLDVLRRDRDNGMHSSRVRVLSGQLTDYELYECHFAYALNAQFEDIRVLRHSEHPIPDGLLGSDYWIMGDEHVALMHYDEVGRFVGAEVVPPEQLGSYLDDRERTWAVAEPFTQWWARHAELHRRIAA